MQDEMRGERARSAAIHAERSFKELVEEARFLRFSAPARGVRLMQRAARRAERMKDHESLPEIYSMQGLCHYALSDYDAAYGAIGRSIELHRSLGDDRRAADGGYNIGSLHYTLGNNADALATYARSLSEGPSAHCRGVITIGLAQGLLRFGDAKHAEACAERAIDLGEKGDYLYSRELINLSAGDLYLKRGKLDRAAELFARSLELSESYGNVRRKATATGGLGAIHLAQHDVVGARRKLDEAVALYRSVGYAPGVAEVLLTIGALSLEERDISGAAASLERALELAVGYRLAPLEGEIHALLAEVSRMRGDYESAFHHLELATHLRERMVTGGSVVEVARALASSPLIDAGMKGEDLAEQNLESDELTVARDRVASMRSVLESVERELRRHMSALRRDEELESIGDLLERITSARTSDEIWEELREQMRQVDGSFLRRLSVRYRDLTQTELRICALLRLNLATKEIARILNVTPHNIDMHRWRIRRKIGLPAGSTLVAHLASI